MRYSLMFYYGILLVGQNEFGPVNISELIFFFVSLVVSGILTSLIFGDIASISQAIG